MLVKGRADVDDFEQPSRGGGIELIRLKTKTQKEKNRKAKR